MVDGELTSRGFSVTDVLSYSGRRSCVPREDGVKGEGTEGSGLGRELEVR